MTDRGIPLLMLTTETKRRIGVMPQAILKVRGFQAKGRVLTEVCLDCGNKIYVTDYYQNIEKVWEQAKEKHNVKGKQLPREDGIKAKAKEKEEAKEA